MSELDPYEVVGSDIKYRGKLLTLRIDDVRMSDGSVVQREIVKHPGAVAVVALDENGKLVLVNQYRPAIGAQLDELPAGLLDVDGESALAAARRELAEEAHLVADEWDLLLDLHPSPGFSTEAVRVFLARDLSASEDDYTGEHEERTMTVSREPLPDAVRRVLSGSITNAVSAAGILAAVHGRATGWRDLRPADAPWSARPGR
ncbi:MAG: 8-oxo-dGDP phosphatase [Pseudonocardiales bacterium]|jgi:ADP-ribose pyrophosphatase|nr:8-oxo-dGDP phosphatase [Pseudonocardiales bacterium]MDT4941907.1 8-oxo-dGDP phosphatase [Pseudonocardiales bacterium]